MPSDFVADPTSLPKVKMPNHDAFIWTDPRPDTKAECLHDQLRKAGRREDHLHRGGKDLTPRTTGPLDTMQAKRPLTETLVSPLPQDRCSPRLHCSG